MNAHLLFAAIVSLLLSVSVPATLAQEAVSKTELEQSMLSVEGSVAKLKLLEQQIQEASGADREALVFRLDQRVIRFVAAGAKLTRNIVTLPADDPDRLALEERLRDELSDIDQLLFQYIDNLEARIDANREIVKAAAAGNPATYVLQAYSHSLETIRLGYYTSLVELIEGTELLGKPREELRRGTEALLYQHAEKISGQIELLGNSLKEVRSRLVADAANTGLQTAVNEISMERAVYIGRLETLLGMMARLDIDTVLYRSVLLRENKTISLKLLDVDAVKRMLQDVWENQSEALSKSLPDFIFQFLIFLLILVLFRALSRLVKRATRSALGKSSVDLSTLLKDILVSGSGAIVMVIGILVALSQVGISLGPALAGLGVAGFILGFALQDTLGNFAAGAMILIYRPYDVDDFVEVTGAAGLVKKMNLVSTTIITFDNQTLIIPNSKIWGDVIKNVTAQRTRRVDLQFGISYGDDIEKAEHVLKDIVAANTKVLKSPEPMIRLHTLGDSSVNFIVRPWTRTADYWDVYWDITREVKMRFDREGISIPFPQRDVHVYQTEQPT